MFIFNLVPKPFILERKKALKETFIEALKHLTCTNKGNFCNIVIIKIYHTNFF